MLENKIAELENIQVQKNLSRPEERVTTKNTPPGKVIIHNSEEIVFHRSKSQRSSSPQTCPTRDIKGTVLGRKERVLNSNNL